MSEQRGKVTLADIEAACATIGGHVLRTPMLAAPPLSALTRAQVYVKYENLQVSSLAVLEDSYPRHGRGGSDVSILTSI